MRYCFAGVTLPFIRLPLIIVSIVAVTVNAAAAEIDLNADIMLPQIISINHDDTIKWVSPARRNTLIESFDGEFRLVLVQSNNWSAAVHFDKVQTNYYRNVSGRRSGIVIVRDWTNSPPVVMINGPQEGDIFNWCHKPGCQPEPVPLMAATTIHTNNIDRVEFVSGASVLVVLTNAPFFVSHYSIPPGPHQLVARVIERNGAVHESLPVNITIAEVNTTVMNVRMVDVKGRKLVLVSWLEDPVRAILHRGLELDRLGLTEDSGTSTVGVRLWIEPADTANRAFFWIRERF
jgi:hypothetical protein